METQGRKYWVSHDKRSTLGSWDISKPDREIWAAVLKLKDFKGENHFSAGTIEVEEMWRLGCWEPWQPMKFKKYWVDYYNHENNK